MFQKYSAVLGIALGVLALTAVPASANVLTSATATANCQGYSLTVSESDLVVGVQYTVDYSFTVTCGSSVPTVVTGSNTFTATSATPSQTITGTFSSLTGSGTCQVTGSATLTSSGSTVTININNYGMSAAPLSCPSLTLQCPASTGQVGVPYSSVFARTGGVPPFEYFLISGSFPPGMYGDGFGGTVNGTPTTAGVFPDTVAVYDSVGNSASVGCTITITPPSPPPPACTTGLQPITYNLSEQSSNASEIVWFNSHFKLQNPLPPSDFTVNVTNGTISFGTATLTVPNATITFSSTVNCASTSFDSLTGWHTTLPLSAAHQADEIFAAGLAYVLPPGFAQNVQGVTWTANFSASASSLQIQWQWGAANYVTSDSKGHVFPFSGGVPDYNAMMVDPGHNVTACAGNYGGDHAGTPENAAVKALVVGGGSGGGGSNWTGSWSSTASPMCK